MTKEFIERGMLMPRTHMSFDYLAPFDIFIYKEKLYVRTMITNKAINIETGEISVFLKYDGVIRVMTLPRLFYVSSYDDDRISSYQEDGI